MLFRWILLGSVLIIFCAMYLQDYSMHALFAELPYFNSVFMKFHNEILTIFRNKSWRDGEKSDTLFTSEELRSINENDSLYLSILGKVYDVGKNNKHYMRGGDYHFFTGRDASRAFVTGDFSETGLSDKVLDLTAQELRSLSKWAKFYKKNYLYKGKLIGLYYNSDGKPTFYLRQVQAKIKQAKAEEDDDNKRNRQFPPCNIEWNRETGSRVWCTNKSGGIQREWVGVPRQLYEPGSATYRCVCLNLEERDPLSLPSMREYDGCESTATSCHVKSS